MGSFADFGNSILRVCRESEWKGFEGGIKRLWELYNCQCRRKGSGSRSVGRRMGGDLGFDAGVRSWIASGDGGAGSCGV